MVFTTEGLLEVAIESWPEWDLNPRPVSSIGQLKSQVVMLILNEYHNVDLCYVCVCIYSICTIFQPSPEKILFTGVQLY